MIYITLVLCTCIIKLSHLTAALCSLNLMPKLLPICRMQDFSHSMHGMEYTKPPTPCDAHGICTARSFLSWYMDLETTLQPLEWKRGFKCSWTNWLFGREIVGGFSTSAGGVVGSVLKNFFLTAECTSRITEGGKPPLRKAASR